MDRRLIDYLPPYVQEYVEIREIMKAEQPEFEAAWVACENALNNQYIRDMDVYGVTRWESMLGIVPKATDTLEERKFRILTRLNSELPYTLARLKEALITLCGIDGFTIELQAAQYHIIVKLAVSNKNNYDDVVDLLKKMIPANMTQYVEMMYNNYILVGLYTHEQLASFTHNQIRNEVFTDG